jgi:hypothetical protein
VKTRPATVTAPHLDTCYRITAGNSLVAHVAPNGARTLHEMPAAAAKAIADAQPARNLIVVTWAGGAR